MLTQKEKIGFNAGALWAYLNETGEKNIKDAKKACKLTDKELYAAMGWLAREGKIEIKEEEKEVFVSLV